jgi:hypothetical protein
VVVAIRRRPATCLVGPVPSICYPSQEIGSIYGNQSEKNPPWLAHSFHSPNSVPSQLHPATATAGSAAAVQVVSSPRDLAGRQCSIGSILVVAIANCLCEDNCDALCHLQWIVLTPIFFFYCENDSSYFCRSNRFLKLPYLYLILFSGRGDFRTWLCFLSPFFFRASVSYYISPIPERHSSLCGFWLQ